MKVVTLCLSCGRWDLLARSLGSFKKHMPVPTELIVLDDSMFHMGQAHALDELVRLGLSTDAEWVVMLEDDWEFNGQNWFRDSLKILTENPAIMIVGISLTDTIRKYMLPAQEVSGVMVVPHEPWRLSSDHGWWHGWISSPRLMRRSDLAILPPFSSVMAEEVWDRDVWFSMYKKGRKSVWLDRTYCHHIGEGRSLFPTGDRLPPESRTWLKAHG